MDMTKLCQEIHNWFDRERWIGRIQISGGEITVDGQAISLKDGQYYRIIGSVFSDGVHQYDRGALADEEFQGAVWSMGVPPCIVALVEKIDNWEQQYGSVINSPYQSESFGGYSYSKKTGSGASGSGGITWKTQFADDLRPWRKLP